MSTSYDVVVIGAGPAGYVAAIRAAQLGMNTVCVDNWLTLDDKPALGGTCLNAGCIPSKAMLESSELFHRAEHEFESHGLSVGKLELDLARMQKRKAGVVSELTGGIAGLFKANGVASKTGTGQIVDSGKVKVIGHDGDEETLEAKHIIIASGSVPVELDIAAFDGDRILDSRGALEMDEVPKKLGVIGAGYIGVELGSVWSRLGSEVTILEAVDEFMPVADRGIATEALKTFKKQGLDIQLGARVTGTKVNKKSVRVEYTQGDENKSETFDRLIVAVGRRPNTANLCAKDTQLELDDKGFIDVNESYRTSLPGVYAVGDVIGNPMLAHKGMEEGTVVAEMLAGQKPHMNYDVIPSVVYTTPELAWVGRSEAQVKAAGLDYRVGQIPFAANGRAKAMGEQGGFVKMIADANTDEILGVHMIGPYVSELIQEIVVAMEYKASSEDIARTIHGHPSLGETVHEAALAVDGRPIHFPPRKKK
ncbi:dihydrolipoyl dehydrogenase [Salinisphaera sp. Q1T1-3]|uniref:dihydrolipoyl dehydrogenase n=1 Tax=Salinisphaera sp. Q1T1-3 TaxID=2321229 RepID=UPI000E755588|nr:dihydrolipoyl dehydrogenase [Salinisphaera sp. Q1T1-3]RJS95268.1 dihydrolipoyl dehydrogenase [Salinisphaera sp. Q1T1-3]